MAALLALTLACRWTWAEARVIDSFQTNGTTFGPTCASIQSSIDPGIPNSFPPTSDPAGALGAVGQAQTERRYRVAPVANDDSTFSLVLGQGGTEETLAVSADVGCYLLVDLLYAGTGGTGLGGQDLTVYQNTPGCPGTTGPAGQIRMEFSALTGPLQVALTVVDLAGHAASLVRSGLPPGAVAFRYADFANAANTNFSQADRLLVALSGAGVTFTLDAIRTACDVAPPPDGDGDGVADSEDLCPGSIATPTVAIDGCDTAITNVRFPSGCSLADLVAGCGQPGRSRPASCLPRLANFLERSGMLTEEQAAGLRTCAVIPAGREATRPR